MEAPNIPEPIDNQAIRELRDELKDLNVNLKRSSETTNRFSLVVLVFAMIQAILGIFQFLVSTQFSSMNKWVSFAIFLIPMGMILWVLIVFHPIIMGKSKK